MGDRIGPEDAALALGEIDRRREQVIRRPVFPRWFWWAQAGLTVGMTACIESGRAVVLWAGVALFVVGAIVVDLPVSRAARAAPPNRALGAPGNARGVLGVLAGFVAVLLGVVVGVTFGLRAAGVPYPAMFAVGGPVLVRWEGAVLVRRSGSRG
jgi:hypothetical protein